MARNVLNTGIVFLFYKNANTKHEQQANQCVHKL